MGARHPASRIAQRATLGSGMMHSEQNGSTTEPMRFIQMWILPPELGLPPSVEQLEPDARVERRRNALVAVMVPAPGFGPRKCPSRRAAITGTPMRRSTRQAEPTRRPSMPSAEGSAGTCSSSTGLLESVGDAGELTEGGAAKIGDLDRSAIVAGRAGRR